MDDDRKWAVDLSKLSKLVPKVTIDAEGIDFGCSGLRRSLDRLRETEELSHKEFVTIPQSGRPQGAHRNHCRLGGRTGPASHGG